MNLPFMSWKRTRQALGFKKAPRKRSSRKWSQLSFEILEPRKLLAGMQLTVNSVEDSVELDFADSYMTLREAVDIANLDPEVDTIRFAPSLVYATIDLVSDLEINSDVTIVSDALVTISGDSVHRIFHVAPDAELNISGLVLADGYAESGGAIFNEGSLVTHDVLFVNNEAVLGGAVFNTGTVDIQDSVFAKNSASWMDAIYTPSSQTVSQIIANAPTNETSIFLGANEDGTYHHGEQGTIVIGDSREIEMRMNSRPQDLPAAPELSGLFDVEYQHAHSIESIDQTDPIFASANTLSQAEGELVGLKSPYFEATFDQAAAATALMAMPGGGPGDDEGDEDEEKVEVSISAPDAHISEVPDVDGGGPEYDPGKFRISRPGTGGLGHPHDLTVYFRHSDSDRNESGVAAKYEHTSDWQRPPFIESVHYTILEDGTKVSVYPVTISSGKDYVEIEIASQNDSDYELLDEALVWTLADTVYLERGKPHDPDVDLPIDLNYTIAAGAAEATITITDLTADIDFAELCESCEDIDEDNHGAEIDINWDDDNGNYVPDSNDYPEVFTDDELYPVTFRSLIPDDMQFTSDYFTLGFDISVLNFWFNQDKSNGPDGYPEVTEFTEFDEAGGTFTVWVEGYEFGKGTVDLIWHENSDEGHGTAIFDSFAYTVWGIDVDIDSDNNGQLERSLWEEELEDNTYGLGKLLRPTFSIEGLATPITIQLPPGLDLTDKIEFSGIDKPELLFFGDIALTNGEYELGDSGYDQHTGLIKLLVRATESYVIPFNTLTELERQGSYADMFTATYTTPGGTELVDEVKILVANEPSIFWEIQKKRHIRAALGASAIYTIATADLPHAGLEFLSRAQLRKLGVTGGTVQQLNNQDAGVPVGFTAGLYRDYVQGPNSYMLAFGGTHMNTVTDWVNNFSQGIADGSPQYSSAMNVAWNLKTSGYEDIQDLVATGHSLGGGLASAASIWAGIHGYTFNSSGLTRGAIVAQNNAFNSTSGALNWWNDAALARYNTPEPWLDAYINGFDILNNIQDSTVKIQSTIGTRHDIWGIHADLAVFHTDGTDAFNAIAALGTVIPGLVTINNGNYSIDLSGLKNLFKIRFTDYLSIWRGMGILADTHGLYDETLLGQDKLFMTPDLYGGLE